MFDWCDASMMTGCVIDWSYMPVSCGLAETLTIMGDFTAIKGLTQWGESFCLEFISDTVKTGLCSDDELDQRPGLRMVDYDEAVSLEAAWRLPAAHQIRQAPSSETMHGPIGILGVQARP